MGPIQGVRTPLVAPPISPTPTFLLPFTPGGVRVAHTKQSTTHGAGVMVRGAFWTAASNVAGLAGGLLVIKLITGAPQLSPRDIDLYMMMMPASDLLLSLSNFGLRAALPALLAAESETEREVCARAALGVQLLASCVTGLLLMLAGPLLARHWGLTGGPVNTLCALFAALVVTATLRETLLALLAGFHRFNARAAGMAAVPFAQVFLVALLLYAWHGGLPALAASAVIAQSLVAVALYAALPAPRRPAWNPARALRDLRAAFPLYLNTVFTLVFQRLDTLLVGFWAPPGAAGIFEVTAKRIPFYATGLLNASLAPFLPMVSARIAQGDLEGAASMLRRTYALYAFIGYSGLFLTLVVQRPLILLIANERFLEGLPALGIVMAAMILQLLAGLMGQSLIALGRASAITVINGAAALLGLGLNAALIPIAGMTGAAYAALGAAILSLLLQSYCTRSSGLKFSWLEWVRPHTLVLVCVLVIFAGGGSLVLRVAALGLFVALAFASRLISLGEIQWLVARLRGREEAKA